MRLSQLRLVLLELCGTARMPDLYHLLPRHWDTLAALAAMHRLEPWLHLRQRGNPAIPANIAKRWKDAHRQSALTALLQQAELQQTAGLLREAGLAPLALKGAWLAWHAYPEAALRPLRDIDLLLPPDQVVAAFDLLEAAGYRQDGPAEMSLADCLRLDKHLPPLIAPRGTLVELHHRLWERDGRLDHRLPSAIEDQVRERLVTEFDGIAYPAPAEMLAHLIVHALYSHRLDCGPLVLSDIACLVDARAIDWDEFWRRAADAGWLAGARLLLGLVHDYHPATALPLAGPAPAPAMVEAAKQLLLQNLETRRSAGFAAAALKHGPRGLVDRLRGVNRAAGEEAVRRSQPEGRPAGWAAGRAWRTLRDLSGAEARRQSRHLAQISRWLEQ